MKIQTNDIDCENHSFHFIENITCRKLDQSLCFQDDESSLSCITGNDIKRLEGVSGAPHACSHRFVLLLLLNCANILETYH